MPIIFSLKCLRKVPDDVETPVLNVLMTVLFAAHASIGDSLITMLAIATKPLSISD